MALVFCYGLWVCTCLFYGLIATGVSGLGFWILALGLVLGSSLVPTPPPGSAQGLHVWVSSSTDESFATGRNRLRSVWKGLRLASTLTVLHGTVRLGMVLDQTVGSCASSLLASVSASSPS